MRLAHVLDLYWVLYGLLELLGILFVYYDGLVIKLIVQGIVDRSGRKQYSVALIIFGSKLIYVVIRQKRNVELP